MSRKLFVERKPIGAVGSGNFSIGTRPHQRNPPWHGFQPVLLGLVFSWLPVATRIQVSGWRVEEIKTYT